ncbi:MAG: carbon-nitrogen hydrolase family protein [Solirubrobacteraceae bacterium]|nr:carbon-nitrogen hydrolase family protein [Solirubrobacteraceae bacterium]
MLAAAVQLSAGADPERNLAAGVAAVREAADRGATFVVLPEKWLAIGGADELGAAAQVLGGPVVEQLGALAKELRIDLIAGSISERAGGHGSGGLRLVDGGARAAGTVAAPEGADTRLHNTSLHFTPDGQLVAAYRKVHLFDADVSGRRYRESDAERHGREPVVSRLGGDPSFTAGLAICFDLRFPDLFRALVTGGANVITLPSAFTERTTRDHWEVLVRARAIELGTFVVAANQCGEHPDGSRSGGGSLIVDPWGRVLARAAEDRPEIVMAHLDRGLVDVSRDALPVLDLRRPDVYERPVGDGLRG